MGFERGTRKKKTLKGTGGGVKRKILGVKGDHQKNSFKSRSDGICRTANSLPECRKPAFLTFGKFRFSRGSMLLDPLLNR